MAGNTIGETFRVTTFGESHGVGLGEPVFDKIDADLAKALMSIPTIKGVEIGSGFASARFKRGSDSAYQP